MPRFLHDKTNRDYLTFDSAVGYPMDRSLFYECIKCGDVVPSKPDDSTHCNCRNIMIDVDYGRMAVQEPANIRLFRVA